MRTSDHSLPADPAEALATLQKLSENGPVLVFKRSGRCGISHWAESELEQFLQSYRGSLPTLVFIDVLGERALARGLTAELDITHQSPQALLFADGELKWVQSHHGLDSDGFTKALDELAR
ncbi:MAG: DUF2847 family protein [Gemmatimonadetes bacterium]|nr:DUF2847 family protein [Gemmatimonadota bacterium]